MARLFQIHPSDTVAVVMEDLPSGVPAGHKVALRPIRKGEKVIKYGQCIGIAAQDIARGEHVHTHNLVTNLTTAPQYTYAPLYNPLPAAEAPFFAGYRRRDGRCAVRKQILILPMVGCVNSVAQSLAAKAQTLFGERCDDIFALTHPYGCSQLGGDLRTTQMTLAGLADNPNIFGVLFVFLGCENNTPETFLPLVQNVQNAQTVVLQKTQNEEDVLLKALDAMTASIAHIMREPIPASELVIGLKCGGSDAFSGLTANVLCGKLCDRFLSFGAGAILTEVPEMFGAEHLLMRRAESEAVFHDIVRLVEDCKKYYTNHGQPIYENPSPGNKAGGITTLEEKSLGCIQKGGTAPIHAVLRQGERCREKGLHLLEGVGNDMVSCTNLAAAGAHLLLFTTGLGTPFGSAVPTIKISTGQSLFRQKPGWIDFDGSRDDVQALEAHILSVAGGQRTCNERNGFREIAIFKDGVTL